MKEKAQRSVGSLLASENPEDVRKGLEEAKREITRLGSKEARPVFEMVSTLFYIDPLDRPDLAPLLEEAISLLVGFGDWVIPFLLEKLDDGDMKAQMAIATALGRLGADAIAPLTGAYEAADDEERRAFILFAMGKIKSPRILSALPLALAAARSSGRELRDTGTRAIGKFIESILPAELPDEAREEILRTLQEKLADTSPGIRAKAVRSLGKLARFGFLGEKERAQLKSTLLLILGKDEAYDWDRAYAVRREAEEALNYV